MIIIMKNIIIDIIIIIIIINMIIVIIFFIIIILLATPRVLILTKLIASKSELFISAMTCSLQFLLQVNIDNNHHESVVILPTVAVKKKSPGYHTKTASNRLSCRLTLL